MTKAGRKFLLALGTLLFAGYIEIANGGVTDGFIQIAALINGIYVAGNVGADHVNRKKDKPVEAT